MRYITLLLIVLAALAGCTLTTEPVTQSPRPTATVAPFFAGAERPLPTLDIPTPAPRATSDAADPGDTSILQATAQRDLLDDVVEEVLIFDEGLDANWSAINSFHQRVNPRSNRFSFSGFTSLEGVPMRAFSGTALTVNEGSRNIFPKAEVLGVRFAVSGGDNSLAPTDLIARVTSSNRYPYYVDGDTSGPNPEGLRYNQPLFDGIPLEAMGLRRDLEPGEWAEVEFWFGDYDELEYDYITGVVFMNDELYMQPFYIDDVRLLMRRP